MTTPFLRRTKALEGSETLMVLPTFGGGSEVRFQLTNAGIIMNQRQQGSRDERRLIETIALEMSAGKSPTFDDVIEDISTRMGGRELEPEDINRLSDVLSNLQRQRLVNRV